MFKNKKFNSIEELPEEIPLLLVRGALLLPKAETQLPIFDNNFAQLASDCLKGNGFIGLIQPNISFDQSPELEKLELFSTGCLGRIIDIVDLRNIGPGVVLEGICRFKLVDQDDDTHNYPIGKVDYTPFINDLVDEADFSLDRHKLFKVLKPYFARLNIPLDWETIGKVSNQRLITALSMACPFHPSEKQALLDTKSFKEQSEMITKLIEMTPQGSQSDDVTYH